jgi:WD40 repeat protein
MFSPDESLVLTASNDGTARIWDIASGKELLVIPVHQGGVTSASFSPDGAQVLTSGGSAANIWNASNGKLIADLKGHADSVLSAAFSPDGSQVLTASLDGTARVWNMECGAPVAVLHGSEGEGEAREYGVVNKGVAIVAFSPDGSRIVTVAQDGGSRLWNVPTGEPIAEIANGTANIAMFSPDGRRVLTSSCHRMLRPPDQNFEDTPEDSVNFANAANGERLGAFAVYKGHIVDVSFTPDGARVGVNPFDGAAEVWDAADGKEIGILAAGQPLTAVGPGGLRVEFVRAERIDRVKVFSPDGRRLITGSSENRALISDVATGEKIALIRATRLWSVRAEKEIEIDPETEAYSGIGIRSAEFSPDGARVITAFSDATARIWDAWSGKEIAMLKHKGEVETAAFSSDGTRLLTASWDGMARIWHAASGKQVGLIDGYKGRMLGAAFNADGTRVATAQEGEPARIWRVFPTTQGLVNHAKELIQRGLTVRERTEHFLDAVPPSWYIEKEKWPYHTQRWKRWLADFRAGLNPRVPGTPE